MKLYKINTNSDLQCLLSVEIGGGILYIKDKENSEIKSEKRCDNIEEALDILYRNHNVKTTIITKVKQDLIFSSLFKNNKENIKYDLMVKKYKYNVLLAEIGNSKISVIKAVREASGLGLKEAKTLVNKSSVENPQLIKTANTIEEAYKIKENLEYYTSATVIVNKCIDDSIDEQEGESV